MGKDLKLRLKMDVDLPKISRMIWRNVSSIRLSLHNHEGRLASLPAIYGVATCALFPMVSFATLYSLARANVRVIIEKR
jgi:hypothetical protein